MGKKNKLRITFAGFKEYAEELDRFGGDLKQVTAEALEKSYDYITPKLHAGMASHNRTWQTAASIKDSKSVEWFGDIAEIEVGFTFPKGTASIFLMYGTPRMAKDQKLFDAVYGAATKKAVNKLQKEVFEQALKKVMR